MKAQQPFEFAGENIQPGTVKTVNIPFPIFPQHAAFDLHVRIFHGKKPEEQWGQI